ncbi:MAG: glutamine amidotransferase, partial [bacterium]|nr:glutamine amidotransferase [bacterium]
MFRLSDVDLSLSDGLLLSLLVPVCLYLAYGAYRSGLRAVWWLLVLRGLALVLVLVLLMEPILAVMVRYQRKPLVAVLVDNSESMKVEEGGQRRGARAVEVIQSVALRELESVARVARFRFSDVLLPMTEDGVDSLEWNGRATDLAAALDVLREMVSDEGLAAAVLISDGAHNLGGRPERAAADLGAPVLAVGIGRSESPRDLALISAVIDPMGYVGREITLSARLKATGFEQGRSQVVVEEGGQQIAAAPVVLSDGEQTIEFQIRPDRAGRHVYRVLIAEEAREQSVENNLVTVATEVLESRLRVLVIAGRPSADLAFLRRSLEADENLELELFVATQAGQWPYQVREQLNRPGERNLIILFDVTAALLVGETGQSVAGFVRGGGGLLVVGGPESLNLGYANSPLADVLPVTCFREEDTYRAESFQAEMPEGPYPHPILRISDDPLADRAQWKDLPPLLAYNRVQSIRPGATVLVQHPVVRVDGVQMPLVAVGSAGSGKAMVVAARTFWRLGLMMWGVGKTDVVSRSFWRNAVQWLVTKEDVARVQVVVDKPVYRSGEPILFRARVFNELMQPQEGARVTVWVADRSGRRERVLADEGMGRYGGQMAAGAQGDYVFEVQAQKGSVD